ncbi:YafY family transcriptional regulator [Clostridium sp. D2Q-11]|uniref:YafY family transcriptional regulator n=1 Tax=Anaeromonas frigoriresistens TaxID=2683708 RepID=A0A942UX82_9FIRM|nr:YafY family protein [Anaeromonas frigoriresistens]MBS4538474.1 YafY family transcriptional regulator [Anaeromonas frigoriresistens]
MRIDRLLSILLILSSKGIVTAKELAEHFEVSVRTIYRDIDKICEAGVPVAANGGKGGGFYIIENYSLDNLFFDEGELHTLMAMMKGMSIVFGKNQQFNDIVLKFQNADKNNNNKEDSLNINMSHFSMEEELKEYLYIINQAIEKTKILVFYYINRNMEYSERIVEPIRIEFSHGQWYLAGYCRVREDYRRFKLVRIKDLKLGEIFTKRIISSEELDEIFNKSYDKKNIKVKLKFSNRIGNQLTEYFFKDTIKERQDGAFIVDDLFPYEEGLIRFILEFGKECEVLEPEYLRNETKKYLENILEKYNG